MGFLVLDVEHLHRMLVSFDFSCFYYMRRPIMLTLSEEQKFHLIFAQGNKSSRERKFHVWNFAVGSKSTWE